VPGWSAASRPAGSASPGWPPPGWHRQQPAHGA
jgi:hypothetical protein